QVMPLKAEEWEKALDVLASQAVFAATLLAGEMPENIEEAFQSADLSLFPERPGDLVTQCSCPDWANPCKHVAAAHYILGNRFDEDPFLLFRMRGRSQEQVLEGLRLHRGGAIEDNLASTTEEVSTTLESQGEAFWEPGEQLSAFSVQIKLPKVGLPILRRLGQPEIIRTFLLEDELSAAYESASQAAMILAYSDTSGATNEVVSESENEEEN
ncbi:MAG TPA: SWIM zinc finger family protein, partial [Leptolinea sp.]